jgi:polyferredoxin
MNLSSADSNNDTISSMDNSLDHNVLVQNTGTPALAGDNKERKMRIKKLSPELRIRRNNYLRETVWFKRLLRRMREDSQFFRSTVQMAFLFLCIWIGIEFYLFIQWGNSNGQTAFVNRPPGAEGFLPISALISFKYWLYTGIINNIHPSGLFIFLAVVTMSLFLKKAFCSWLCPIGTLSESLWMLGQKLFKQNITVTKWLDYLLRSLKYLLAFFFIYAVWQMDIPSLKNFIYSPYNKVADIKMYLFFANISSFALWTIILLIVFSIVIKNFWCRYLCPYGAFLGALSWLSPFKITRNKSSCIDCELCTEACPANIKVHKAGRVRSDECSGCHACVAVCPVKNTLDMRSLFIENRMPAWIFGTLVVGVFIAVTGLAILTGKWHNNISREEYLKRIQNINSPIYEHFRGEVHEYGPND